MRNPLVIANWKMNGSLVDNSKWFDDGLSYLNLYPISKNIDIVVAPSFVYLSQAQQYISHIAAYYNIFVGTQDISCAKAGAYTGEVSVEMVKDFGVRYVIVGHSERRTRLHEDDVLVAKKVQQVLSYGLCPVLCVGESIEERQLNQTKDIVSRQLSVVLKYCKDYQETDMLDNLVLAYEPIWAIGTGEVATPEQAQEVHCFLREQLAETISVETANKIRIIYGGSVKPNNAKELFMQPDIDGALVGGASLNADSFMQICALSEQ